MHTATLESFFSNFLPHALQAARLVSAHVTYIRVGAILRDLRNFQFLCLGPGPLDARLRVSDFAFHSDLYKHTIYHTTTEEPLYHQYLFMVTVYLR